MALAIAAAGFASAPISAAAWGAPPAAAGSAIAPDSTAARVGADSTAARDSAFVTPAPIRAKGVADTVTALPPIRVDDARGGEARTTATSVRLDRAAIARFAPLTASDALASVPGVDLVKTGPWASRISVRGLSGDRVLVLVDGVRVNGARGHGAQSSLVAIDRLDAIELQPGASSAQYGSDALGGVVNFVTHRSLLAPATGATLTLQGRGLAPGSGWSESARVRVTGPRLGVEFSGGLGGLDALVTPEGRLANSGNREQNAAGRISLALGGGVLDYEHARNAAYDIGLPAFSDSNGSRGRYPLQARDVDRLELSLPGAKLVPDAALLAALQTSCTDFDETTVDPWERFRRPIGTVTTEAQDRVRTRAAEVQPSFRWPGAGNLRVSGSARHEVTSGPRTTTATTRWLDGRLASPPASSAGESMPHAARDSWSVAAFAAPSWRRLRLESGARWDDVRSHADSTAVSHTSPRTSADRRLSLEAGLARPFGVAEPYLHAASGFRVPNLEERYYHDEIHGGMTVFGNENLSAERSESFEAGLRLAGAGIVQGARLSAYRSNVEDMISIRYLDMLYGRPRFQYQNVKHARVEGLEATLQLQTRGIAIGIGATLPRATDLENGKRLTDAGTPRATLDLGIPVAGVVPNGVLSLRVRWNDAVVSSDTTLARRAFSSTALELASAYSGIRAVFAVRNLWNANYREPLSFIPEPGRTFALSLRRDLAMPAAFFRKKGS